MFDGDETFVFYYNFTLPNDI